MESDYNKPSDPDTILANLEEIDKILEESNKEEGVRRRLTGRRDGIDYFEDPGYRINRNT